MSNRVYELVTNDIISKLETVNPSDYQKPWFNIGVSPYNAISKKNYRGVNFIMLGANAYQSKGYTSFKQWQEKDCMVRKGEKSHLAVFWKINQYEDEDTGKEKTVPLLRYYRVFNSEQVDGDFARQMEQQKLRELNELDPIAEADKLIEGYLQGERIKNDWSDRACYIPSLDKIEMPQLRQFRDAQSFYNVFFHEMTHSTGAEKRLERDLSGGFNSKSYAKEELVAELGAAMLCGAINLEQRPRIDHAQYIAGWLTGLRSDPKFVIQASAQAQKAVDYIQQRAAFFWDWNGNPTPELF